jgi:HD-GYP domain-containing protein (c-di-GMP phosphodiesterase class II)
VDKVRVKTHLLEVGLMLNENIYSKTGRPIMNKGTLLSPIHIELLQAFLIDSVDIGNFKSNPVKNESEQIEKTEHKFSQLYADAVKDYKKLFMNWQAGANVDLYQVRQIISPLIETENYNAQEVLTIYKLNSVREYSFHHAISVSIIAAFIGNKLNLQKGDCMQLALAGVLSDCGMAKVPTFIFEKKDKLNEDEFNEVKKHPVYGYQMLKKVTGINDGVLLSVLQHHEREDGSGYPLSTKSAKLHVYSQIVAVADVFHAMTSERLHAKKHSPFSAIETMTSTFGQFNPTVLKVLVDEFMHIAKGMKVRLNDGNEGEIVFIEADIPTKPLIKIDSTGEIISLKQQTSISIEDIAG